MEWLPRDCRPPGFVALASGHHLRPIRESDVDIDFPAVMGSRERLWSKYGAEWGWPAASLSYASDREDLARHEAEIAARQAFNYAILDPPEAELFGCVYIDPPEDETPTAADAVVSWWVVDHAVGTALEAELDSFLPRWLEETWGFSAVHFFPADS